MNESISDAFGVEGHIIMTKAKTKGEWIAQARKALDDSEKYGATCPNEMKITEKDALREALIALGANPKF